MVVRRLALLIAAAAVVLALYTLRLIFLQLVHGEEFAARATSTTEYRFNVTAARGDIVDSAGRRIATSTTCYNVELSRLLIGDNDLNETIRSAVEILQANGESWNDTLLIGYADGAGHYAFTGDADSTSDQNAIARVKEALGLQQYATADDVMDRLIEEYELEGYDPVWQRILGGIHYQMEQEAFSNVNNFVLAEDVSDRTVATVKEHSLTLPGVEIAETSVRSYTDGTILPHVLGRVGKITAEMWRVTDENGQTTYPLRDRGYAMNDVIGISGLESAYEEQLRGQDGVETITRDSDGVIIDTSITTEPQPGKTVMLTVNSEFQKAVDEALARNVQQIAGPQRPADRRHLRRRRQRRRGGGHRRQERRHSGLLQLPQLRPEPLQQPVQRVQRRPGAAPVQPGAAGPVHPRLHLQALGGGGGAADRGDRPQQHRLLQRRLQLFPRLPPPLHPPRPQRRHRRGHRHQVELQHLFL